MQFLLFTTGSLRFFKLTFQQPDKKQPKTYFWNLKLEEIFPSFENVGFEKYSMIYLQSELINKIYFPIIMQ